MMDREFTITLPVVRASLVYNEQDQPSEYWLTVMASGTEPDKRSTRMTENAIDKMVIQINQLSSSGSPLLYNDGHYEDLLSAELGEIYNARLIGGRLGFDVKLDSGNPSSLRLYNDVVSGKKRHGASIQGDARGGAWNEELDLWEFSEIHLRHVARTYYPVYPDTGTVPLVSFSELVSRGDLSMGTQRKLVQEDLIEVEATEEPVVDEDVLDTEESVLDTEESVVIDDDGKDNNDEDISQEGSEQEDSEQDVLKQENLDRSSVQAEIDNESDESVAFSLSESLSLRVMRRGYFDNIYTAMSIFSELMYDTVKRKDANEADALVDELAGIIRKNLHSLMSMEMIQMSDDTFERSAQQAWVQRGDRDVSSAIETVVSDDSDGVNTTRSDFAGLQEHLEDLQKRLVSLEERPASPKGVRRSGHEGKPRKEPRTEVTVVEGFKAMLQGEEK